MKVSRRDFGCSVLAASMAAAVPTWAKPTKGIPPSVATLIVNGLDPSPLSAEYLDLLSAGGVSCWHRSGDGVADFSALLDFCDRHKDRVALARSVRDIQSLHRQGKISIVSGWQSADVLIEEGGKDGPAIDNLRAYHELGLRICGIAYNLINSFGGGCLHPDVELTGAGRKLVEAIHRLGMLLDVGGHTGERTSLDALAMSSGVPVICSHTNIKAITDNPRCMSDRLIEAIAKTGGVIGITAFNDFHVRTRRDSAVPRFPQVSLEKHLDQYDYLKKLVGAEYIGLGPDFIEGRNHGGYISNEPSMSPLAYSQQLPWFYVKGFENIGELPNVAQGLLDRGWSAQDVRKVLGENWLRVYAKVWGA